METDMLPPQIDDSIEPPQKQPSQYYYGESQPQYYYEPPPVIQDKKKGDIFSELDRTHWIILACAMLLAFFMGKSMTPVIIRNV